MDGSQLRRAGALGAVLAMGATGLASAGAQADGDDAARAKSATISMELKGKRLFFEGPGWPPCPS